MLIILYIHLTDLNLNLIIIAFSGLVLTKLNCIVVRRNSWNGSSRSSEEYDSLVDADGNQTQVCVAGLYPNPHGPLWALYDRS